jgi:hypothetical protein
MVILSTAHKHNKIMVIKKPQEEESQEDDARSDAPT